LPRKPRCFLADIPVHIDQRGHSREPVFFEDSDYRAYLGWLAEAAERYECSIHAYVLMTNHIHILATPQKRDSVSRMMQYVGRRYVPYVNHAYGTSGSIWEGRFKASLIQDEQYLLTCMRYIELNPVRANMTTTPGHYRWSSYRAHGQGKADGLAACAISCAREEPNWRARGLSGLVQGACRRECAQGHSGRLANGNPTWK
jgi:putative transposase